MGGTLLERERLVDELLGLVRSASAGKGSLAFVGGEAGVGKTALVRELRTRIPADVTWLESGCEPLTTPMPLAPVYDVAAKVGGRLARMLADEAPRADLFQTMLDTVRARATVLVLEDVHWADDATHDLLRFLGRRIEGTHALVVATLREEEVQGDHPLRILVGDLTASTQVSRLRVPPLSRSAVRTLATGSAVDADELYARTGGNAFFVTEVLAAGAGTAVPSTVRDAVFARVARLPAETRLVLEVAGVVGARADPDVVMKLSSASPQALESCLASGLLRMEGASLVFRHELARMAVVESISPARRLTLHRGILALLRERAVRDDDLALLAHHAEEAGDAGAVLEYAPRAARHAARLRAHREAADQYARALRYADDADPDRNAALLEARSLECYFTGQGEGSYLARERALSIRRTRGDPEKISENLRWLSRLAWVVKCGAQDAYRFGQEAVEVLDGAPPTRALAWAYSNLAQLSMLLGRRDESLAWGDKAVALAKQLGEREVLVHALNNVGTVRVDGDEGGWEVLEESLALALELGLEEDPARAWANLGSVATKLRLHARADRALDAGIAHCVTHDLDAFGLYMTGWKAELLLQQGRLREAADRAGYALAHPRLHTMNRITSLVVLGKVRARRGDPDADEALDEALTLARTTGAAERLAFVRAGRAEAAWLEGDDSRAREEVDSFFREAGAGRDVLEADVLLWGHRAGRAVTEGKKLQQPYALEVAGRAKKAADAWLAIGCPYDAALALGGAQEEGSLRHAVELLDEMGAEAAKARIAQRLRQRGASVPRGKRASTRENPAELTAREVDVLRLVAEGMRNAEISRRLFIAPKTVDHHVSSMLGKLGVTSRIRAVRRGVELGILPNEGQALQARSRERS